jgi:hypothetical protein
LPNFFIFLYFNFAILNVSFFTNSKKISMKKSLFFCLFFLSGLTALHATHIVGGSMFHKYLGGNTWEIQLDMYRDCENGEPYFDSEVAIGIFDELGVLVQNFYAPFDHTMDDTLDIANVPVCFPVPYPVCVHRGRYIFPVELPATVGKTYRVVYQRCCRNVLVQNIDNPLDMGMTFMTTIRPEDLNSSAKLNNPLPFYAFNGTPFVYDAGATDADGDSMVYRFSEPVNGADRYFPLPNPPSLTSNFFNIPYSANYGLDKILGDSPQPLTINPNNGEMNAMPAVSGYFIIGFDIDEYRNGALITTNHHEIMVVVNEGNYEPLIGGEVYLTPTYEHLDAADIQLIQRNPINDSLLIISNMALDSGKYAFLNVFTSKYYVRALPTPGSVYYETTFPTFHPNKFFWYNATEVEVCDFSQPSIHIYMTTDSLDSSPLYPSFIAGKIIDSSNGLPIADYEIWLMDGDPNTPKPLKWAKTDNEGNFLFKNLRFGHYQLFANDLNSDIKNDYPVEIRLNAGTLTAVELVLSRLSDRLEIKSKTTLNPKVAPEALVIKPNPTSNTINLDADFEIISAEIFDVSGKLMQTETTTSFSVKNLPQGVYSLRIKTLAGSQVSKFMKM